MLEDDSSDDLNENGLFWLIGSGTIRRIGFVGVGVTLLEQAFVA